MEETVNQKWIESFRGFSKLKRQERLTRLKNLGFIESGDIAFLNKGSSLDIGLAEKFIENVIGYFQLPLGVAVNFVINGKSYAIPMAVEETSIIAAASKTARWVQEKGQLKTKTVGHNIIGQIQLAQVKDFDRFESLIIGEKKKFVELLNKEVCQSLVQRGGGVEDLQVRKIIRPDGETMAIVHVLACTCEAMGANTMNQAVEYLKGPIEKLTNEKVSVCILSNLVDTKITEARVEINDVDEDMAKKIEEASLFAQLDPYRAATHNKGVLNGIDPILIATGNDWRAVEAGIHAYASLQGQYQSITRWVYQDKKLIGTFRAPIILGIVGGMTQLHPMAKLSLKMMDIKSSDELAQVCSAVGLIQNLGALKALTSVGIIEGHMKLHIKNLALSAGAQEKEALLLQRKLEEKLSLTKRISLSNAIEALRDLRDQKKRTEFSKSEVMS